MKPLDYVVSSNLPLKWDISQFSVLVSLLDKYINEQMVVIDALKALVEMQSFDTYDPNISVDVRQYETSDLALQKYMEQHDPEIDQINKQQSFFSNHREIPQEVATATITQLHKSSKHNYGRANLIHLDMDSPILAQIRQEINDLFGGNLQAQTGAFWYPKKGYMGWHTNENNQGIRCYIVYSAEKGKSWFKWRNPNTGGIICDMDEPGWNMRTFPIGRNEERLWHCVYSDTDRFSLGFNINRDINDHNS